ncbi:MAG: HNH endonuclease [Chlorobium sp.]|nr:MAG: HNH endonuclease [Chlorobium sp.]
MDWQTIFKEIEDKLMPHFRCDVWERGLYYYLLRHTRIAGLDATTIPLSAISGTLGCSESQARKSIRSLAEKGCIELEQTRKGHYVKVFLPNELSLPSVQEQPALNIEEIDFFKNREYLDVLLKREQNQCFYCLREIKEDSCELDHVVSQLNVGDNGYRNIVASCHQCNTKKQGGSAEDFIRQLSRKNLLSEKEFEGRIQALEALKAGQIKPEINR